jgi:hypothetical protein
MGNTQIEGSLIPVRMTAIHMLQGDSIASRGSPHRVIKKNHAACVEIAASATCRANKAATRIIISIFDPSLPVSDL